MKIATWNINSIRARKDRLLAWLSERSPDVVCLQETKVVDAEFPTVELAALGYKVLCFGQKTYNGVAILARSSLSETACGLNDGLEDPQCRLVSARVDGVRVVSVYVPNGGTVGSDKYAYKLEWLGRLVRYLERTSPKGEQLAVCGDFNVAPTDKDAAHPEAWSETVLCHPSVREAYARVVDWGLVDVMAQLHPEGGIYSWWDYRMLAFPKNDGLRLDLILATPALAERCERVWVDREARKGKQASDHAPVIAEFKAG